VPFTSVYAGKHRRQIKNTNNTKTKHNPETNSAKHNYPGPVVSYETRPGHEVGPHGVQYM